MDQTTVETTIGLCIERLLDRVERYHGRVFVSHALGYLTASKDGLGDVEMEDILSLDDVVLNDVFQHWLPPVRRIPPLLIPRLQVRDIVIAGVAKETTVDAAKIRPIMQAALSPVYTSNNLEATFDFVEATVDFVAKNGNNVVRVYRKISSFRPSRLLPRHCCQKQQQCRINIRLGRRNRSTCSIRQCCFDIVAGVDGALAKSVGLM